MILRCLLYSNDDRAVRLLRLSLDDLSIEVEHTTDLARCKELLLQQKFDGIVADCELADGPELLRSVRYTKHNRRSIVFALTGAEITMRQAFDMGAHFIIYKPLVLERVKRTISAAHGLMMREKRQHFRHPAKATTSLRIGQRPATNITMLDLSQHGALLDIGTVLKKNQQVQVRFTLPDTTYVVEADARVTWSDPSGRAGIHFEFVPEEAQAKLVDWVIERSSEGPLQKPAITPKPVTQPPAELPPAEGPADDLGIEVVEQASDAVEGSHEELAEPDSRLRATLRGQHRASLKVLAFENGVPVIVQGKCQNLSELGLAATVDEALGIGDAVLLQVEMPGGIKPVVLHATVRHHQEGRYGFEFIGLDPALRDLMRESVINLPVE